ncbi:MAG TPA: glucose-1-phosphate adenylyltransferase family protein [Thermomicrobiales bacterium]|nr:glucose-1-phosphate adenylyltransferase family protein [Thermomicrobiales bacterium]
MSRNNVLALVLAGGQGGRMEVLTRRRAKPAMPYAGVYRLIDFSLSNLRNSHISDVWLVVQYETQSIIRTVAGGRPWDLDRTHGGLTIVPPQQEGEREAAPWHEGNADAIYQNRELIRESGADTLLVLSADHIYKLDYNDVIDQHRANEADVTLVSTEVPIDQASNHATVKVDEQGRVTDFRYKPDAPDSPIVAAEIFVYRTDAVIEMLERLAKDHSERPEAESGLEDFGDELLPELVRGGKVFDFRLPGYWKDVGRPETYYQSHMDLLRTASHTDARKDNPDLNLDDASWPIITRDPQRMPARIHGTARIDRSLVSPGCDVAGKVERSVLSPGVIVEEGATVHDTILLQDVVVRAGATVRFAIVDEHAEIGPDATVGQRPEGELPTTEELVLIGSKATITEGATVAQGARIEPDARVRRKR